MNQRTKYKMEYVSLLIGMCEPSLPAACKLNVNVHFLLVSRAPTDCLQYFTGSTGTFQSYNYQSGSASNAMLQSQTYTICIRKELGKHVFSIIVTEEENVMKILRYCIIMYES